MTESDYNNNQDFDYDNNENLWNISELIRRDTLRYQRILDAEVELNEN